MFKQTFSFHCISQKYWPVQGCCPRARRERRGSWGWWSSSAASSACGTSTPSRSGPSCWSPSCSTLSIRHVSDVWQSSLWSCYYGFLGLLLILQFLEKSFYYRLSSLFKWLQQKSRKYQHQVFSISKKASNWWREHWKHMSSGGDNLFWCKDSKDLQ